MQIIGSIVYNGYLHILVVVSYKVIIIRKNNDNDYRIISKQTSKEIFKQIYNSLI